MSEAIIMEFIGFESKPMAREYMFTVREPSVEPRDFTLTISNESFDTHRVRYQDAPDVCSRRLRRELASHANHPTETHFHITDIELDDYRAHRTSQAPASPFARKRDDF
jgi:hypothetical protein